MKKGILRIAVIMTLFVVLLICTAFVSHAETNDVVKPYVRSNPVYIISYGYTLQDAFESAGILRLDEDGTVKFRPSEDASPVTVEGTWIIADDPDDENDLTRHIIDTTQVYAVFTPTEGHLYSEIRGKNATVWTSAIEPVLSFELSPTSHSQNVGCDVTLNFSAKHPKYNLSEGLPKSLSTVS